MGREEMEEEMLNRAEFLRNLIDRRPVGMHELLKEIDEYRKEFYRRLRR